MRTQNSFGRIAFSVLFTRSHSINHDTSWGLFGASATSTIPIISLPLPRHEDKYLSSCSLPSVCALPTLLAALACISNLWRFDSHRSGPCDGAEYQNIWLSALECIPSCPTRTPGARGDRPGLSNPTSPHGKTHAQYDWKCIRRGATVDKAVINKSSNCLVSLTEG